MRLYHGTSLSSWEAIQKHGIMPREGRGCSGNWHSRVESNPGAGYLTTAYAPFFGVVAAAKTNDNHFVVIEIDDKRLDHSLLLPDEDALEQVASRQWDGLPRSYSLAQRTKYYRSRVADYASRGLGFSWSLMALGTGATVG